MMMMKDGVSDMTYKTTADIDTDVEKLKIKISKLETKKKQLEGMTLSQKVAEILHDKYCYHDHTESCSWLYESWEFPGATRNRYLIKANILISTILDSSITKESKYISDEDLLKFIKQILVD